MVGGLHAGVNSFEFREPAAGLPARAKLIDAVSQPPTPTPAPPFCSDCTTKMQPAGGGPPTQSASRMWRSSDGKFRLDTPKTSVITDPASQKAILLDHVKKEATIVPMTPAASGSASPGSSQAPAAQAQAPQVKVEDLGKSMIEGHEVEGKRFTLPPFEPPSKPEMPKAKLPSAPQASPPGAPKPPAAPGAPSPPKAPKLPTIPSVTEVWTSVKLKAPVLTKVNTTAGEQTTYCKPVSGDDPHPSVFQIPQGYKIKPPKV
jgi:hypothetical protein